MNAPKFGLVLAIGSLLTALSVERNYAQDEESPEFKDARNATANVKEAECQTRQCTSRPGECGESNANGAFDRGHDG